MHVATSSSAKEPLRLVEIASPALRPGELRVRVHAIGVNPVDWKMREGGPLGTALRLIGPPGPLVMGIDFAGEVMETTPDVKDLVVGDRVVGGADFSRKQFGSYATEVVVRPDQCAKLPENVSYEAAACLPVAGVTAYRWLLLAKIAEKPNARVLILGASGGVGLFALQIAKAMGAEVVGVCSARNAALVSRLGAKVLDYGAGDPLEAAKALGPFDLVLNAVGSEAYSSSRCRALLAKGGVLGLVVVRPADYLSLTFSPSTKTLLGKPTRETLAPLVDWVASGKVEPIIEAKWPLAQAEEAHQCSRKGKVVGKLLLIPAGIGSEGD